MVGIAKKVKQIVNLVRKYSPFVDTLIPGFSSITNTALNVGEKIFDGATNIYDDYKAAKKKGKKYSFVDGVSSFIRPGALAQLSKDYGDVHPRLGLSEEKGEG
jgi:hypothetical protein